MNYICYIRSNNNQVIKTLNDFSKNKLNHQEHLWHQNKVKLWAL